MKDKGVSKKSADKKIITASRQEVQKTKELKLPNLLKNLPFNIKIF